MKRKYKTPNGYCEEMLALSGGSYKKRKKPKSDIKWHSIKRLPKDKSMVLIYHDNHMCIPRADIYSSRDIVKGMYTKESGFYHYDYNQLIYLKIEDVKYWSEINFPKDKEWSQKKK